MKTLRQLSKYYHNYNDINNQLNRLLHYYTFTH